MGSNALDQKKVAVITGSTVRTRPCPLSPKCPGILTNQQSGIGESLAKTLHARGYNVAITGRRPQLGETVASALDPSQQTAFFTACDVSSYASQCAMFQAVWDKWGRIDVFIANAGGIDRDSKYNLRRRDEPVTSLPPEPDTTCTDVDYKGVIYGIVLATHFMRPHNSIQGTRGKIIVTGSIVGIHPLATMPEYCGAKAAVLQYVRTVAPLLKAKEGITVNIVLPCGVDTPAMPDFAEAFLPEELTTPECLLRAFDMFLLDDEANDKTGMAIEAAHDQVVIHELPAFKGGIASVRSAVVYEPWFEMLHGEKSELKGALLKAPVKGLSE